MDSFFVRFRNSLVLIAIVLVQVIALAVQVQKPVTNVSSTGDIDVGTVSLLRRWSVGLMTPFERATHGLGHGVQNGWQNYVGLRKTKQQNDELKQEVARLREEQASFAEDAVQGRRLQALLEFKQKYISETVAAQVIGTSGSDRSHIVWLDKGSADGLKPEQAVITPYGVVGKLRDVFPHTSQVVLLNDATAGAGVVLVSSRIRGILRGTAEGQVQIVNLTSDSRIKVGEQVVTSGGDMVFPRGLPVGTIESIVPDLQHQPYTAITIKPAANLAQVAEVLVITGTQSTLPAVAQADADLAVSTEEDKQRAADVLAQKLPSLSDGATGATGTTGVTIGAGGTTPPVVQKVPPTLHPDKYSQGSTPSAEELRPGAKTAPDAPVVVPKEPNRLEDTAEVGPIRMPSVPQGLKPSFHWAAYGTAEAVPLTRTSFARTDWAGLTHSARRMAGVAAEAMPLTRTSFARTDWAELTHSARRVADVAAEAVALTRSEMQG